MSAMPRPLALFVLSVFTMACLIGGAPANLPAQSSGERLQSRHFHNVKSTVLENASLRAVRSTLQQWRGDNEDFAFATRLAHPELVVRKPLSFFKFEARYLSLRVLLI